MSFGEVDLWCAVSLIALLTLAAARAALRRASSDAEEPMRPRWQWLVPVGAFVIVWGASWLVVDRFAASHPFWDQWTEAFGLYKPFADGSYAWSDLVVPHNEHRIALTRLWTLAVFELDGLWDNRTVAAANALLHASGAALLLTLYARRLRLGELAALALVVVVPSALPLAWENVPYGFQSQFYFLVLYGPLAIWLTTHYQAREAGFWLGVACAVLALLTVGSGPLCAVAILFATLAEALRNRTLSRDRALLVLCCLVIAVVGLATLVEVERHRELRAHSAWELIVATLSVSGFPGRVMPALALLMWAPALIWGIGLWREKRPWRPDERFLVAFGAFVLLHAVAIAWARGGASLEPSSRYFDVLLLGLVVNGLAALELLRWRSRRWHKVVLAVWLLAAAGGVGVRAWDSLAHHLPGVEARAREQERRLRRYLQSADFQHLQGGALLDVPYPDLGFLRERLDDPFVRAILPRSLLPSHAAGHPSGTALDEGGQALLISGGLCWGLAAALAWRGRRQPGEA